METNQNKIPRGRWLRIMPPIMIACIVSYMDRVNIGFAIPGGMGQELALSASMAGFAGGIFFFGYLFLQIPGGQIAALGSGKKFIAWSLVAWAVISVLTGFVRNQYELLALRFVLGLAEGGMLPVVLTMISHWFPDEERGRANATMIMFVPIAGMITAPLSGVIISALDWRYLFIIEGIISGLMLLVWWFMVSDRPQDAKWLSDRERAYIQNAMHAEQHEIIKSGSVHNSFRTVLKSKFLWFLIALNFFYQTGIYGYTLWLPTILKNLTHGDMGRVGLLAIFPYLAMMVGMLTVSVLSDRTGKRKPFVVIPLTLFATCLFLSVTFRDSVELSYLFLIGSGMCLQAAAGVFWTIPARLFNAEVAGGVRGLINALGNLGGFCGPYIVGALIQAYDQKVAIYSLACSVLIAAIIAVMLPNMKQPAAGDQEDDIAKQARLQSSHTS
jgi:sugar phosphate permease